VLLSERLNVRCTKRSVANKKEGLEERREFRLQVREPSEFNRAFLKIKVPGE
jgi:hypothetical protein